jgi:hypothetical protein
MEMQLKIEESESKVLKGREQMEKNMKIHGREGTNETQIETGRRAGFSFSLCLYCFLFKTKSKF